MNLYQSDSLIHLMTHVIKLHRYHLHQLLQDYDVYPGQPPLLMRLSEKDGQSQNELAGQMQVKPATLTVMITRMEKTDLVRRRPDNQDHRISRVYLTEKGSEIAAKVKETLHTIETVCFTGFTLEEKLLLRRFLLHMYENMKNNNEKNM